MPCQAIARIATRWPTRASPVRPCKKEYAVSTWYRQHACMAYIIADCGIDAVRGA